MYCISVFYKQIPYFYKTGEVGKPVESSSKRPPMLTLVDCKFNRCTLAIYKNVQKATHSSSKHILTFRRVYNMSIKLPMHLGRFVHCFLRHVTTTGPRRLHPGSHWYCTMSKGIYLSFRWPAISPWAISFGGGHVTSTMIGINHYTHTHTCVRVSCVC